MTAFVKGLALLHFQGLLKQMQDSLTNAFYKKNDARESENDHEDALTNNVITFVLF